MGRRCTLCGEEKESGVGKKSFVCDGCLGLKGRDLITLMRGLGVQDLTAFHSQMSRIPTINLREYEPADELRELVTRELCEELLVIPVSRAGSFLIVAFADPEDTEALEALAKTTNLTIEPVLASASEILAALDRFWSK